MFQLCYKLQIGADQILFSPLVDSTVQFWAEVIFPVTRFTCNFNLVSNWTSSTTIVIKIMSIPLRINLPSWFIRPSFFRDSLLTDSFFVRNYRIANLLLSCPVARQSAFDWGKRPLWRFHLANPCGMNVKKKHINKSIINLTVKMVWYTFFMSSKNMKCKFGWWRLDQASRRWGKNGE